MATTKRKSTVNPAARTRAIAPQASSRKATSNHPRAIALAVATAFLPWYLPPTAYAQAPDPNTLPTGGQITNGAGQIHAPQGTHLQIDQYTQKMIAEFGSFSIGANASVNLSQPGASSIALFRDVGGDPSKIFGNLTANGQLFISNQNGVLFGASARVDVGALIATSLSITDHDFMAGRYHWYNEGNAGSVVNQGQIVTANGYTALVGPQVRNDGIIIARAGSVALAAGDRVSLDMIGDGLISLSVDQSAYNASVINTGSITADGGTVLLTARSANALLDTVINNSGMIRANSLVERNGEIVLDGGYRGVVSVTGTLQAAGVDTKTTGGTIKVLGDKVGLFGNAVVDASGDAAGGTVFIGGNFQGNGPEANASRTYVGSGVRISADAISEGDGGKVIVWADDVTRFYGTLTARGGSQSGDGGFAEISGKGSLDFRGNVDLSAANGAAGTVLFDPLNITISTAADANTAGFTVLVDQTEAFADDLGLTSNFDVTALTGSFAGVATGTTIELQAENDITLQTNFNLDTSTGSTGVNLTLRAGNNVDLGSGFAITSSGGNISVTANDATATTPSGSGSILGDANIVTTGVAGSNAGNVTLATSGTGTISVGNIIALGDNGGALAAGGSGGAVSLTTVDGNIAAGTIQTSGGNAGAATAGTAFNGGNAGSVTVQVTAATAPRAITMGAITATGGTGSTATVVDGAGGAGGLGGSTTITAAGGSGASLVASSINTAGGTGGASLGANSGGAGGDAAVATVTVRGGATISGSITTSGGVGGDASGATGTAGNGGNAAAVSITSTTANVSVAGITATGGAAGASNGGTAAAPGTAASATISAATNIFLNASINVGTNTVSFSFGQGGAGVLTIPSTTDITAGTISATGGPGSDAIVITRDADMTLSDGSLAVSGAYTLALTSVEVANLTGGAANNSFTVSGWSGTGTLDGAGGTGDSIVAVNDLATIDLTDLSLARATLGTLTLANIEVANLTGGTGVNAFTVSGWTGSASLTGDANNDSYTVTFTGAGSGSVTVVDSAGTDTLTVNGIAGVDAFTLTDSQVARGAETVNSMSADMETRTVNGLTGIDSFTVSAASTYNLNGGDGADVFALGGNTLTGSIDGQVDGGSITGIGSATLTGTGTPGYNGTSANVSGGFSNITNLSGTGTLTGTNNASGWSALSGTGGSYTDNAGTNSLTFSGFATLQGGTAVDTFTLTGAATFALNGGDGLDVFALAGNTLTGAIAGQAAGGSITGIGSPTLTNSGTTTGFDGTSTNVSGNFTDITSLSGTGTLTGDDAVSSWAVSGNSGTYTSGNALTFSGFATLQGGTAVDTFTLGGATTFNLNGGDGVDVFALGGNTLTGAIAGQAAGGSITGIGSATLTNQGATAGFDGTSANVSGNFTDIASLSGTGTLTGDDVASIWTLDGTPTYSDGTRTLDIAGFANLQGGTAADTFNVTLASTFNLLGGAGADVFTINAALTGTVSGEGGSDTLQGTQIGSTALTGSTAADGFGGTTTGVTGFSGIDVLNGSGTLTGRDVASTWSVDAATYTDGTATLTHSGFGTLQGGTAIDTFNLAAAATANLLGGDGADIFNINAALTGSVNGEVGNDTLSGSTTYVVSAANAGTASNLSAGFSSIENLAGTAGADTFTLSGAGTIAGAIDGLAGTDTLTGANVANAWTINAANSGTLTGTGGWANIENLVGGTGTDSFSGLGGSVGGTISDGGGGATTLSGTIISGGSQTYSAAVSSAGVTLNAGTAAISATNAGNNFTGEVDVTGSSASITDMNALMIDAHLTGGLITVSGALTYVAGTSVGSLNSTASGAVNQTGAITVTGATSINAGGNSITLTSANDFQGPLSLIGGTTQVTDVNALALGNVNVGAFTTINTGALNLGTLNASTLTATTNGGSITQSGPANVAGATTLQAGSGSIMLALANDFGGVVAAGGIGITLNDVNTLTPGTINAGSGSVNLSANSLGAGGTVSAGSASSFSSNTNVSGLDINMPNVPLALSGAATQWNLKSTPTSIAQPNPVTVPGSNVGVTYNLASIIASVAQQQAASASSSVSATVAAVIVDEANKTFGTDSVAEDVEYGFAGEVGATPPMDHRIDESGISLPRCVEESREGMPCK